MVVGPVQRTPVRDILLGIGVVVGASLAAMSAFLRWVSADIPYLGQRVGTGWENIKGEHNAGLWVTLLAIVIAVVGALIATGVRSRGVRGVGFAACCVLVGTAAWEWFDLLTPPAKVNADPGIGMWILSGAAVACAVGTAMALRTAGRDAPASGGAPPGAPTM